MENIKKGDWFYNPKTGEKIEIMGVMKNGLMNTRSFNSPDFPSGFVARLFASALDDFERLEK
jgi:hypothetical protein